MKRRHPSVESSTDRARTFARAGDASRVQSTQDDLPKDVWVPLASIARPHGVRGEVRLSLFNKSSDALLEQEEVLVRLADGEEHEVSVERARRADDAILMKLYSVDDRDRADELRGAHICVRRRDFPAAEEGEFYAVDVVGSEAQLGGQRLGVVTEIMTYPTLETMFVRPDDGLGDWEIPLTNVYVGKVDTAARVVEILTLDELERTGPRKKKPKREPRARRKKVADGAIEPGEAKDSGDDAVPETDEV